MAYPLDLEQPGQRQDAIRILADLPIVSVENPGWHNVYEQKYFGHPYTASWYPSFEGVRSWAWVAPHVPHKINEMGDPCLFYAAPCNRGEKVEGGDRRTVYFVEDVDGACFCFATRGWKLPNLRELYGHKNFSIRLYEVQGKRWQKIFTWKSHPAWNGLDFGGRQLPPRLDIESSEAQGILCSLPFIPLTDDLKIGRHGIFRGSYRHFNATLYYNYHDTIFYEGGPIDGVGQASDLWKGRKGGDKWGIYGLNGCPDGEVKPLRFFYQTRSALQTGCRRMVCHSVHENEKKGNYLYAADGWKIPVPSFEGGRQYFIQLYEVGTDGYWELVLERELVKGEPLLDPQNRPPEAASLLEKIPKKYRKTVLQFHELKLREELARRGIFE